MKKSEIVIRPATLAKDTCYVELKDVFSITVKSADITVTQAILSNQRELQAFAEGVGVAWGEKLKFKAKNIARIQGREVDVE